MVREPVPLVVALRPLGRSSAAYWPGMLSGRMDPQKESKMKTLVKILLIGALLFSAAVIDMKAMQNRAAPQAPLVDSGD